jgi:hypothetical protein
METRMTDHLKKLLDAMAENLPGEQEAAAILAEANKEYFGSLEALAKKYGYAPTIISLSVANSRAIARVMKEDKIPEHLRMLMVHNFSFMATAWARMLQLDVGLINKIADGLEEQATRIGVDLGAAFTKPKGD